MGIYLKRSSDLKIDGCEIYDIESIPSSKEGDTDGACRAVLLRNAKMR